MADKNMNAKINVDFEESTSRQSLNSGDSLPTLFGKIKKFFSDLKSVCFSGSYNDLSDKPTTATKDTNGLMSASDKTKLDNADNTYALKSKYGDTTINVGRKADSDVGEYSTAEGHNTTASGGASHAEGLNTTASGAQSHAEGVETIASGSRSHAEGLWTIASGGSNHAEGKETTANGNNSCHAEGSKTTASGIATHAEGNSSNKVTDLITDFSWNYTTNDDIINAWITQKFSLAHGRVSHVEGSDNLSLGHSSHSEGCCTVAIGNQSHTSGYYTKALHDNEAAYGKYNESNDNTLFSIGDGTADDARHNAFEITTTGGKLHDKDIATTENISNPNLLINPNFRINQRGKTGTIAPNKNADGEDIHTYFVDRWGIDSGSVTMNSDGTLTLNGTMSQILENAVGSNVTASVSAGTAVYDDTTKTFTITGNGDIISWAKLEIGSVATPFSPPEPATELIKCQRYYQIHNLARQRVWYYTADMLAFFLPNKVLMRSGCTATINGTLAIFALDNRNQSGFNFVIEWAIADGVKVCAKKTAHGLTDAILYVNGLPSNGQIEIDAEIY